MRVALQPRNVFNEFPKDLPSSIINEIHGEVYYPDIGQTNPINIAFQNFFLADGGYTIIAEAKETIPAVLRTTNPGPGGPLDT